MNINSHNSVGATADFTISSAFGLRVELLSNTVFNIVDLSIAYLNVPISCTGDLIKRGVGYLELNGTNSFTGDILLERGYLIASGVTALGSGEIIISNLGDFRSQGTINNRIGTIAGSTGDAGTASIAAVSNSTMTLTGILAHLSQGKLTFRSTGGAGTIVADFSNILQNATNSSFTIDNGTLRFANAYNATNLFQRPGNGLTKIIGTLDTNGFSTIISNLDLDGNISTSSGALNVTVE